MSNDKAGTSPREDLLSRLEIDWRPETLRSSTRLEHVPFAFWLVAASRPRCIVELGTQTGGFYFAFCQAVERLGLPTQCFAVDTWQGNEHEGSYGDETFNDVVSINESRYRSFSTVLRTTFDRAREYFSGGEVDLLHIDGCRTYDAVARDFASWRSKLSLRGIVLFHDINTHQRDIGAWKLWAELSRTYPHFAFDHGYGLGVLGVGDTLPPAISALLRASQDIAEAQRIRSRFAARGQYIQLMDQRTEAQALARPITDEEKKALLDEIRLLQQRVEMLSAENSQLSQSRNSLALLNEEREMELARLRDEYITKQLHAGQETASALRRALERHKAEMSMLRQRHWLIRKPSARKLMNLLPSFVEQSSSPEIPSPSNGASVHEIHCSPAAEADDSRSSFPASTAKVHKVVWLGGEPHTPGYRYRVVHPCEAAKTIGFDATHMPADQIDMRWAHLGDADVVVLWRTPWDEAIEKLVTATRQRGGHIVFDIDDLIFEPALATAELIDSIRSQKLDESSTAAMFERFRTTLLAADSCTASTVELVASMRALGKPARELCNGYDALTLETSRLAVRRARAERSDDLVRIGYAAGTSTHQRDFAVCANALAKVLRNYSLARLVLFRDETNQPYLDPREFPELLKVAEQIEWRRKVPLLEVPNELARFDINLAPLQLGNPFCEAKSELKYFEAALVDVCTIASPTGPYRRAIDQGENGLLAADEGQWHASLARLIEAPEERERFAMNAHRKILETFGPEKRKASVASVLAAVGR